MLYHHYDRVFLGIVIAECIMVRTQVSFTVVEWEDIIVVESIGGRVFVLIHTDVNT